MARTSPTVRQRELGTRLRELRRQRDLTVEDVAEKLLCSATRISRLETGARRPGRHDVRDLCELYGLDESTSAELMTLASEVRSPGWWTQYEDLNLDPYLGLEQDAIAITSYSAYYIPGLLQSEDYARAVISAIAPMMDPAIRQQRVASRMRRQQILEADDRPRYRVLLDESALHRCTGGTTVMGAQLDKVLQAVEQAKLTIQVIPFNVGVHAAQDSNFVMLEFNDESRVSPVVFVEGLTGNRYLEGKSEIARYREAIVYLRDAALSARDSISLIAGLRAAYGSMLFEQENNVE
ncbi:MAG TPA: helix-turn-helix transcriptional regulator [Streptosporangiaceae bacterium]|nr:helix-turn-helix transcriptional regulator [Streptosporangiaceae bacterium]